MLCGIHPGGPGGGVDFQGTFVKKTCGRENIFYLGGLVVKICIGSFGVAR